MNFELFDKSKEKEVILAVGERSYCAEVEGETRGGAIRSENVRISNK